MDLSDVVNAQRRHGARPVRRILIVDDSRLQRKILSSSLKRWGFEVDEAESGREALSRCETCPPDLVLSDWVMPGMNGLDFCKAFRRLPAKRYVYFILLTSKSEKDEVAQGLDAGADDFLTKPVNAGELRARITAGERILRMERELTDNNRLVSETLAELQSVYDVLDSDLIEAKKLQQSLLRERHKKFENADLSLLLRSSGHVGGDLVGFYPAGKNRVGLFAIDVSGHGISSALMTARLAGCLSSSLPDQNVALGVSAEKETVPLPPGEAIKHLNELILNEMETEHYFTLLLADVDLESGDVRIGQAGHPHPLIQRANGRMEHIGPGGFPVGLLPDATFSEFGTKLGPGDRLLILSDGVTECPGTDGQLLGESGLEHIVCGLRDTTGPAMLEALVVKLGEFSGGQEFPDDVSAILFDFLGPV